MATVQQVYIALFGRPADPFGLQYWQGQSSDGADLAAILPALSASPEYTSRFEGQTSVQMVNQIYIDLFGRPADLEGLTFFVNLLNSGEATVGDIAVRILDGATGTDAQIIANKTAWADAFTASLDTPEEIQAYDANAIAAAQAFLAGIGVDDTDVDQAAVDAVIADIVAGFTGVIGETFTLTTGIDNLVGTNNNDTFLGAYNGGAVADGTTINTGDTINGGAGNDKLSVVVTVAGGNVVPNLTSVETVEVQNFSGGGFTVNLANSTGVQTVALANGSDGVTATNVQSIVDIALTNTTGGTATVTYSPAVVAGSGQSQNVAVNSAIGAVSVAGVEIMNVTSTGAAVGLASIGNELGITAGALEELYIDGSGDLTVTTTISADVVDASAATGDITVTLGAAAQTVTGGSGDDTFIFGANLGTTDTVDGGEGFDRVSVVGADYSLAAGAAPFNALVSIEQVEFTGAVGAILNGSTFTNTDITHLLFNTGGDDIINNAGSARLYQFGSDNAGGAEFRMNAASTELNIELLGEGFDPVFGAFDDEVEVGSILVELSGTQPAGTVATINLTSTGTLDDGDNHSVGVITAVAGSTLNIDGEADLVIVGPGVLFGPAATAGFTNNIIVDASALTGNLAISGSDFAGNAGAPGLGVDDPTVATNTGVDIITLGEGEENVVLFSSGLSSGIIVLTSDGTDTTATGQVYVDIISNFTAGDDGDVLDSLIGAGVLDDNPDYGYTALAAATQTAISALSGSGATLLAAANLAANASATTGWTAFDFQGATYAFFNTDGLANDFSNDDLLVQINGIAAADLTADNFA